MDNEGQTCIYICIYIYTVQLYSEFIAWQSLKYVYIKSITFNDTNTNLVARLCGHKSETWRQKSADPLGTPVRVSSYKNDPFC